DKDGLYLDTYTSKGIQLTNDYVMSLPLKPGTYSFVVLGGDLLTYRVGEMANSQNNSFAPELKKGITSILNFSFLLDDKVPSSGPLVVDFPLSDLFHGILSDFVAPPGKVSEATIDLMKDTKRINVHIIGLSNLDKYIESLTRASYAQYFDIYINAQNGRYTLNNEIDKNAYPLKHLFKERIEVNDTLKTSTTVLRLMAEGDKSYLNVSLQGKPEALYNKHMVSQILQNPKYKTQQDLDKEDEFTFEIYLGSDLNISIKINGWNILDITPESETSNK
ncbi:MAG: FimB/Mfa2 family fimbrial subunit, partial [Tannerellaceae bacterium]